MDARRPPVLSSFTVVASERYQRDVRKALTALREGTEDQRRARVAPLVLPYVGHMPKLQREELWDWYVDRYSGGDPRFPDVMSLSVRLGVIIDVFDRAYDARRTPLDDDEWELVRHLANEGSPEMPMDTLSYVMQLLMDQGRLG
jgi:hypothetical protein